MVKGLELFKEYFKDYKDQYVLIGGAACDINFDDKAASFRVTKDLDMVLIVEALTPEFGNRFWQFIKDGGYENKAKAHMDLKDKKEKGEKVKSDDVAKHHKDIVRLTAEMLLHRVDDIPAAVREDMRAFINSLDNSPFNSDVLQKYGLTNEEVKNRLTELYL